ncbi:MAG: hypothetical protein CML98_04215 [Rhodobiaceae bacterium]|nr:hypothetical protein [Rhodobiaceae bacterium]|tara:strand:+ start:9655 stop:9861 length:207 start_codon:yes stop_codon:yes gene_type:complete
MKNKKAKKDALINLTLLFFMKNNTKDEKLIELAAHLIGEIIADHKITDSDILKVYRKLNQFIMSFDNE